MSLPKHDPSTPPPSIQLAEHHAGKVGFRIAELSTYGIGKAKAHQLIRRGRLRAVHLDGCVIVPRAELERYLASAVAIVPKDGTR